MSLSVLSHWGVTRCEDVVHMVFNLIGAGIFGKTDEDSMDDFKAVYDFRDAFVKPFQPEPTVAGKKLSLGLPTPKTSGAIVAAKPSFQSMLNSANLTAAETMPSP